jgi:hypothetical protein
MPRIENQVTAAFSDEELDQIHRPRQLEKKLGVSWEAISRPRKESVLQLGEHAVGMRLRDALRPVPRRSNRVR